MTVDQGTPAPQAPAAPTTAQLALWADGIGRVLADLAVIADEVADAGLAHPPAVRPAVEVLCAYALALASNAAGQPTPSAERAMLGLDVGGGYGSTSEAVHDLHLRGAKLRWACPLCHKEP